MIIGFFASIPSTFVVGLRGNVTTTLGLSMDFQLEDYSSFSRLSLSVGGDFHSFDNNRILSVGHRPFLRFEAGFAWAHTSVYNFQGRN